MTPGTIVAERPYIGGQTNWLNGGEQVLTVYTPFDDSRVCRWQFVVPNNNSWRPLQVNQFSVGPLRACKVMLVGPVKDATISYPNGDWATRSDLGHGLTLAYSTGSPVRRLVWTADQAYEHVLVRCHYFSGSPSLAVTIVGSGTIVRTPLTMSTAGSIWNGAGCSWQKYVVVASNVAAGDVITFLPAWSTDPSYLSHIIGVKAGDAEPGTADAMMLDHHLLASTTEPALDSRVIPITKPSLTNGNHLVIRCKDSTHAYDYWGSQAHQSATMCVTGLAHTVKYFDATHITGTAWAPNAGDRLTTQQLQITSVGTATIFGVAAGTYTQVITISPEGPSLSWQIAFNAAAVAAGLEIGTGGYRNMGTLDALPTWVDVPGQTRDMIVAVGADTDGTYWYGDEMRLGGGNLKDIQVRYTAYRPPFGAAQSNGQIFLKRYAASYLRPYFEYFTLTGNSMVVTDGMTIGGGGATACYRAPGAPSRRVWP